VQSLLALWNGLDLRRRLVIIGATLAMFLAVLAIARQASAPSMALLYAGLESAAAGEVVRALDQRGVRFEVRGDSIWVPLAERDSLRMALAGEGLPANGTAGYELLDSLSGFGTTTQMFDAAYLRAKEGELARTIVSSPQIRAARVHIAQPQTLPFRRDQRPTASVTITVAQGGLLPGQARALKYLVASAVAGLAPEDVAIIDAAQGLILGGEEDQSPSRAGADRATELRRNLERMLAARVGPGRAMVEVSVELGTERESIVERRFDPEERVAISTETEESAASAKGEGAGVTVASNLPEGDTGPGSATESNTTRARERVNYEVSETQRELERAPGAVRRLTVAVLVDGVRDADGNWTPRSDGELADLRDLVAAAVGYDEARGDLITIKSMELDLPAEAGTLAEESWLRGLDPMALVQLAVIALVALVLGLFVIRPILAGRRLPGPADLPALAGPGAGAGAGAGSLAPPPAVAAMLPGEPLTGEIDGGPDLPALARLAEQERREEAARRMGDPVERLRKLIAERREETIVILRSWVEDSEERG
jgi:flagellar M-ring protein FliF